MEDIPKARIFDIQRMSTEDGPGIRTTVFFKGCNLSCLWCHNPESISQKSEVEWLHNKCIGCLSCKAACKHGALKFGDVKIQIDRNACINCLECVRACPANALISKTREWGIDELLHEVIKDRAYFENGNGGVTVSGGEALLQHEFVLALLKKLKSEGVHTAVDTAGAVCWETIQKVTPYADLILYDLKVMDPNRHKEYTGIGNDRILDNLINIADTMRKQGVPKALWIRTPIIPDMTSGEENVSAIGEFIRHHVEDVMDKWELCSFNNLCRDKYERLDREWICRDAQLMTRQDMETVADIAAGSVACKQKVFWSGLTRTE